MLTTHTTSIDIAALRHAVRGSVLAPGDDGWDEARTPWNLAVEQHPALIVVPANSADVQEVVRFAAANGLRVAPQGTGHGVSALGDLSDAVLVRMHRLRDVQIDVEAQEARVGAGAIWEDVVQPAAEHGLAVLHGSSPDVGVAGYTLGGGMGWLARKHGFAANSLSAIELVTADGEFHRVDHTHERDLFFALRGGGGNFGIVTAFEFTLIPLETVYAGWLVFPWERSEEVLGAWRDWTETTPDEITSVGRILQLPPLEVIPEPMRGRNLAVIEIAYIGDEESGRELVAPLLALEPELSTLATMPVAGLIRLHNDPEGNTPGIGDGSVMASLPDEAIRALVAAAGPGSGSPFISVELRQLGGALGRPTPYAGALSHIEGQFLLFSVGLAFTPEMGEAQAAHLDVVDEAMAPWRADQAYLNFAERPVESERFYPGSNHDRLREIRERFDPSELFRANQRIEPSGVSLPTVPRMPRPLRVGVQLPEVERVVRWPEYAAMARAAEEVGFDSIWLGDHLLYRDQGSPERGPWDAWTFMAALAGITERVTIGPLVACLGFHPPGLIARMAAGIDEISGGRFVLGVGSGWNEPDFRAFGLPFDHLASRFLESFEIVRRMLAGEHVTLEGRFWQADDVVLLPPPARRTPIMLGTSGPRQLAATLPHADSWNTWWDAYGNRAEGFAPLNDRISAIAESAGREPAEVERSACVLVSFDSAAGERPRNEDAPPLTGGTDRIAQELRALAEAGAHEAILVLDPITEASVRSCGEVLAALDATAA